jgi:general secretion pathway protein K
MRADSEDRSVEDRGVNNNRGSILVAVLFICAVVSVFLSIASMSLHAGTDASRSFAESLRAEEAMRAAIDQITALAGPTGPPRQGGTLVTIAQTSIEVRFSDEISRIDLNNAPIELLTGIFRVVGIGDAEAKSYAARIVDWRDTDDRLADEGGAERTAYRAAGRIDGPRNGPFQHVAELALVLGIPPQAAAAVAPYVTVASGSETVNPLLADPPVLMAIPGLKEDQVRSFVEDRLTRNLAPKDLIARLGDVEDYVTDQTSKAVRYEGRVRFGGKNDRRFEVIVSSVPGDSEPYRILAWDANPPERMRQLP